MIKHLNKLSFSYSLNAKMLYVSLISIVVAVIMYLLVGEIGCLLVEKVYMSEENIAQRKAEIYSRLSTYVNDNGISGKDTAAMSRWARENDYVTILLYDSGNLHRRFSGEKAAVPESNSSYDLSKYGRLYPLKFSDGMYLVAIVDSSQSREYVVADITAIAAAGGSIVLVLLFYMNKLTKRIIDLSRAATTVSSGRLEMSISAPGQDELGSLARAMDEMRQSVIEQMSSESRAWQANNELITAISHDIRTPMTSMIGYLGLLCESDFSDTERCRQFSRSAYSKAMDLKSLTDELFKYFLVYGSAELKLDMENYDGRLLLEQLTSEAEFTLTEDGFKVQRIEFSGECSVMADPLYLKRVTDNLVSNVMKYGDKGQRVTMISELKNGRLSLCISNGITRDLARVESTKIGLRTCLRIMEQMHGSFEVHNDGEHFAAELSIPANIESSASEN